MSARILVVDDERDFLDSVRRGLITGGHRDVRTESDPREARALFERGESFDVALIDITMPGMNGLDLLEFIKSHSPTTECIMVSALNEAQVAVECLRKGAYDYLTKPVSRGDLILKINHAQERKRLLDILDLKKGSAVPRLSNPDAFKQIVTRSPRILGILREAELHAASDVPILITGESGTGKELLARAVHVASPRARHPFMPVNMASLTGSLFDAEFFGHTRGAFTGADRERAGYLEYANNGTLFLDEIGNLPADLQGKLLRVLQEGEYIKLGASNVQKTNIRLVAATNEDLPRLISKGRFRRDLYYRLKGAWLHLPPLRERIEDVPVLAETFVEEFRGAAGITGIDETAVAALMEYDFPGNIRELRSIIQAAANLAGGGPITAHALPNRMILRKPASVRKNGANVEVSAVSLAEVEKAHILKVYDQTGRNKVQTAKLLEIGLNTLRRKLDSYGVT